MVRLRSWGIVCAGSPRCVPIVRLVQRRAVRLCLLARPRVASLALDRRLEAELIGGRVARAPGLTRVLVLAVLRRRRAVRECLRLVATRGLVAV